MTNKIRPKSNWRQFIEFDFERLVDNTPKGIKLKYDNKLLLSPSRLLRIFNEYKLFPIPDNILNEKKQTGINLMNNIKTCFDNKYHNYLDCHPLQGDIPYLANFFKFVKDYDFRVYAVEKFVTNGVFCGYIDICGKFQHRKQKLLEIKTRSNLDEIRYSDIFQCYLYKLMTGWEVFLLNINDKGYKYHDLQLQTKTVKRLLRNYMKLFSELGGININYKVKFLIEYNKPKRSYEGRGRPKGEDWR